MNISEYLTKTNEEAQSIYQKSMDQIDIYGKAHHQISCLNDFADVLFDKDESQMLRIANTQIESAILSLAFGLYRQAYASLRLSFEMSLGVVHFSVYKMEHFEWLAGKMDISWSKLIDEDKGILSKRFCLAFFPELKGDVVDYRSRAVLVYRNLSEFVHGNHETWSNSGLKLTYNEKLEKLFFNHLDNVFEITLFVLVVRYLQTF
jgi:hypothetical protein